MAGYPQFTVYTLEFCPNCDLLKAYLAEKGYPYEEQDMSSAESLTEMRVNGVFVNEAPVLRLGDDFYTSSDLFEDGHVRGELVDGLASGE
ncbi:glutaredoxin family protein [Methanofollis aquaemaris]|uniref:Glutaredoxin family protein n=1 Tax=Methanofollis aquaemaris TaxID=126734 RepID=A0A8A3S418_9EURY|nr:glutathione S-transferase N-terminal domain-containing protein [Methanofollis aquaemaris]QSZ66875.1 glutaredoxin family protein [Methanofollis aquaemaris]